MFASLQLPFRGTAVKADKPVTVLCRIGNYYTLHPPGNMLENMNC